MGADQSRSEFEDSSFESNLDTMKNTMLPLPCEKRQVEKVHVQDPSSCYESTAIVRCSKSSVAVGTKNSMSKSPTDLVRHGDDKKDESDANRCLYNTPPRKRSSRTIENLSSQSVRKSSEYSEQNRSDPQSFQESDEFCHERGKESIGGAKVKVREIYPFRN